ncbi:ferrous iron transport protein B [Roseateles terrae]|uniref:Ferrous iron transport protein B n=1 Tax=Roseateles terrae TaxID=431060 RepID=A0ABR6GX57_9BURK|nr:ferrous iron transport protein B [Roseateles terrae]MBB3196688.1 ferrous iron transport protein B [Roseateles terrae]OWQ84933.1 ferrous iron transport protein B [Roseateles terrae]
MREAIVHVHPAGPLLALVGNPNCGKTALFNRLTGSRQKVANYAGVTVERKEGRLRTAAGKLLRVLDLPGTYSLYPRSPDERVTVDVLAGRAQGEKRPDLVVCVLDATNLRRNLRLFFAVQRQGVPCVVALNMSDLAARRGIQVDTQRFSQLLGVPVVRTVATDGHGLDELRAVLDQPETWQAAGQATGAVAAATAAGGAASGAASSAAAGESPIAPAEGDDQQRISTILRELKLDSHQGELPSDKVDRVVLHPVLGPIILAVLLFFLFQAVFSWAEPPKELIEGGIAWLGEKVGALLPEGYFRSLIVDGLIAGVGSVLVFLPQILILFFFILILEESGYLPRAAFLLDRIMGSVGLSGRSFIPLLSSFACAIPGIMATRSIANPRDRLVTILIAPLMTCSARLPVYALLIGAFIPERTVWGGIGLQGLVLFALYMAGIVAAMGVAWVLKRFTSSGRQVRPLMMELPSYHWPHGRSIAIGLWQRTEIFIKRVGTIILALTLLLWLLSSFPAPPPGATGAPIEYSIAGMLGRALAVVFEPIGFNWQISLALVPGLAAREIAVSALGTVYSLSATAEDAAQALTPLIVQTWSLPTAFSLLAWYVFAPQCLSTIAAVKRETNGYKIPAIMLAYLFGLAYLASWLTFHISSWMLS